MKYVRDLSTFNDILGLFTNLRLKLFAIVITVYLFIIGVLFIFLLLVPYF